MALRSARTGEIQRRFTMTPCNGAGWQEIAADTLQQQGSEVWPENLGHNIPGSSPIMPAVMRAGQHAGSLKAMTTTHAAQKYDPRSPKCLQTIVIGFARTH